MATPTADTYAAASGATIYAGRAAPVSPAALSLSLATTVVAGSAAYGSILNSGGTAASWALSASPTAPISPSSGTLAAGASVSFGVTPAADGSYSITLSSAAVVTGSPAALSASAALPPPAPTPGAPQPFVLTSDATGSIPFATGYVMAQGHVPAGSSLSFAGASAKLAVLSTWPDGSARHGIIAGTYTSAGSAVTVTPTAVTVAAGTALTASAIQSAMGANTAVIDCGSFGSVTFSGADFAAPFKIHAATDGFIEAVYRKPVGSDAHLVAWLSLRVWAGGQVEALPWIENGYMRVAGPTNKSATYSFSLGGTSRFSAAIDLPHHTRTPLVSGAALSHWLADVAEVNVKLDPGYIQATRMVPTYSATVAPSAAVVTSLPSSYTPLQLGNYTTPMGAPGYHRDIGLLPEWDVLYLTSTASSTWAALQRNAYSAGRWAIHYRDESTNRIPRFSAHPNWSTGSSTTLDEPPAPTGTAAPGWDIPHHPSVGYMAYLVTGRWYHLETLQHAAAFNWSSQVDNIRGGADGVFVSSAGASTVRGAAWAFRTLAQAAVITPDADTDIKAELLASLNANINWNHTRYVEQANNPFGFVAPYGDTYVDGVGPDTDGKVSDASWQQDFYTGAWGYGLALKHASGTNAVKLTEFFHWKARSIIGRLQGAGPAEWLYRDACPYPIVVALVGNPDWVTGTGPWPATWGAMYAATYTTSPGPREVGDLRGGNLPAVTSYWGDLMPALSYAVEHKSPGAYEAYRRVAGTPAWAAMPAEFNEAPVWSVRPQTIPSLPSWLVSKAVNEWAAVPNSTLQGSPAWTPMPSPGYFGIQTSWVNAENGLGLDETDSTIWLFGGGHHDYAGNELASFKLDAETPVWALRAARSAAADITPYGTGGPPFYLDGRPASRHTYQGTHFERKRNSYLAIGGFTWSNPQAAGEPVTFDLDANAWEPQGTWSAGPSVNGAYPKHPLTEDIYYAHGGGTAVYRLNTTTKAWTTVRATGGANYFPGYECAAIDTARNALVILSTRAGPGLATFRCYSIDLATGALTLISFNPSAALTAFQALDTNHGGLTYNADDDCYYYVFGGTGQGGVIWKVTPNATATWDMEQLTMTGVSVPAGIGVANGNILSRFRYIPALRAVIALPSASAPMYIARMA